MPFPWLACRSWDEHEETAGGCCCSSEHVEILFSAIYGSVNELGAKASAAQGRDVTGHLVEIVSPIRMISG